MLQNELAHSTAGLDGLENATTLSNVLQIVGDSLGNTFLLPLPMHQVRSSAEQGLSLLLSVQINLSMN